jgi:RNA polymerase sigma-70 factor (ECF subfamily)
MDSPKPLETTIDLLNRARNGDAEALDSLIGRYLPPLQRWARGRLPRWARNMADTDDIVQEALVDTFRKIESFEHRGEGALRAYLRQAVMNRIRDELRKAAVRRVEPGVPEDFADPGPSPLEATIGQAALDRYEAALVKLRDAERDVIIARVELGFTYPEIARATGRESPDAARMAVTRALMRLTEEMARERRR